MYEESLPVSVLLQGILLDEDRLRVMHIMLFLLCKVSNQSWLLNESFHFSVERV